MDYNINSKEKTQLDLLISARRARCFWRIKGQK